MPFTVLRPAAAVAAVAAIFGGLYGTFLAGDSYEERKREEAVARLRVALGELLKKVQHQAKVQFEEMVSHWENRAEEVLKEAAENQKELLESRLKLIENSRHRSLEEIKENGKNLEASRKVLEKVMASLVSIQKTLKPAKKSNERSI
jgi:vacuolar-type H+-ATPase subunit E/Vma4